MTTRGNAARIIPGMLCSGAFGSPDRKQIRKRRRQTRQRKHAPTIRRLSLSLRSRRALLESTAILHSKVRRNDLNEAVHSEADQRNAACKCSGDQRYQPLKTIPHNRKIFQLLSAMGMTSRLVPTSAMFAAYQLGGWESEGPIIGQGHEQMARATDSNPRPLAR